MILLWTDWAERDGEQNRYSRFWRHWMTSRTAVTSASSAEMVRHHGAFTARHWCLLAEGDLDPRDHFAKEPWFELACQFVDDWDMQSFDPDYESYPLEHFVPLVRDRVTGA